eukprot:GHVU01121549.1.p1 GENE.GHVU01121549.1~~GHVU01121549.1.p1  ORF type:complete len:143 (+),score=5.15 GHVU01121549.1:436-864(+)
MPTATRWVMFFFWNSKNEEIEEKYFDELVQGLSSGYSDFAEKLRVSRMQCSRRAAEDGISVVRNTEYRARGFIRPSMHSSLRLGPTAMEWGADLGSLLTGTYRRQICLLLPTPVAWIPPTRGISVAGRVWSTRIHIAAPSTI